MKKKNIKYLIEQTLEKELFEHREELSKDYVNHIQRTFPEMHQDLVKLANFAISSVKGGYSPTKKLQQLSNLLKIDPDLDPRNSGDTHGVRLYIDHFIDDNKLAGQAKRWYQSTLDQLLKKYYTAPRKKREKKFKKYAEKRQNEELHHLIDNLIEEHVTSISEVVRKPFNMEVPNDIKMLSKIFESMGHQLYIVGGAVRDALLGKSPKDYDLVTDANPERILEILKQHPEFKTLEVGKAFGVINVITPNKNEYEIATFRSDI